MREIEIIDKLSQWVKKHFEKSDLLIEKDVNIQLNDNIEQMRADLVVVQSKSNIIHTFEIKNKLSKNRVISAIWQVDSLYGNYKWLVVDLESKENISLEQLEEKGIGLIVFNSNNINNNKFFTIEVAAKYIDGNLMKYYPTIEEKWSKKKKNVS